MSEPRTVPANGLEFAYLEQGSGPLVVLLHGFPDTAHTWDHALPALAAAGYRAVAPFLRGYHPTAIPADGAYDYETLGKDVIALVAALAPATGGSAPSAAGGNGAPSSAGGSAPSSAGGSAPSSAGGSAIIVGHDWGAVAAYAAASLEPACVRLLVTLAIPHMRSVRPTPILAWKGRHVLALRRKRAAEMLARDDFAYIDELVRRWSPAWDVPATETAHVKAAFRQPGSADAACGYYRAASLRLPPALRGPITVPTIAFAGMRDLIAPRAFEKARHCFTSSYEVVQVPGGHFMHREHPDEFTAELVRVIRDFDRSR